MTQAWSARLRVLGLDEREASPALVGAMRQDFLGLWLPYALCDIFVCLAAKSSVRAPTAEAVLRSWGLPHLAAPCRKGETDAAIDAFRADAAATPEPRAEE